jgi:hypothetical protein
MKHQQTATPAAHDVAPKKKPARSSAKHKGAAVPKDFASSNGRNDLIRKTAYFFYEARSGGSGNELDDWLQAETQVDQMIAQNVQSS